MALCEAGLVRKSLHFAGGAGRQKLPKLSFFPRKLGISFETFTYLSPIVLLTVTTPCGILFCRHQDDFRFHFSIDGCLSVLNASATLL